MLAEKSVKSFSGYCMKPKRFLQNFDILSLNQNHQVFYVVYRVFLKTTKLWTYFKHLVYHGKPKVTGNEENILSDQFIKRHIQPLAQSGVLAVLRGQCDKQGCHVDFKIGTHRKCLFRVSRHPCPCQYISRPFSLSWYIKVIKQTWTC